MPDTEYQVRCEDCGWTGDREDYCSLENLRCPDCNSLAVFPDRSEHPEAFTDTDQTDLGSGWEA